MKKRIILILILVISLVWTAGCREDSDTATDPAVTEPSTTEPIVTEPPTTEPPIP